MIVEATNIHKSFGHLQILKGVNLGIKRAEIVSIIGKSGAGKSTLLHILGTLDNADQGEIKINNQIISTLSSKKLAAFRKIS